ncbi:MAG: ABC transporter substrate-binding protein [Rhodospirillaceae bacterium]|nr:ABC transporter substrate-binding protein [Rhodospirillaceae bacterium]
MRARDLVVAAVMAGIASAAVAETVLKVATVAIPQRRGDPYASIAMPATVAVQSVYDTLTNVADDGTVEPALAVAWRPTGPRNWEIKLRPGVRFHNGEPLTAEAVVASVAFLTTLEGRKSVTGANMYQLARARAIDALTVDLELSEPDAILPLHMSAWRLPAPGAWAELGPDGMVTRPVGTGPYRVTSWTENRLSGVRFAEGWRPGQADRIEINSLPDQTARLQALTSGAVDLAIALGPDDRETVESVGGTLYNRLAPVVQYLGFLTVNGGPITDARVRRALNYAVNREAIIQGILGGHTRLISQIAFPGSFGFNPDLAPYPYDPAKAKALLAEAGHPDGFDMVINIVPGRGANDVAVQQQIAQDLRAVGVRVQLKTNTQGAQLQALFYGKLEGQAFNMFTRGHDPLTEYRFRACTGLAAERAPFHCDAAILPKVRAAYAATDAAETHRLMREILSHEYDDPPGIFLWQQVEFDGLGKRLRGYTPAGDSLNYADLVIAE